MELFCEFTPCERQSSKDLVVFLHGWGMHGGVWSQIVSLMRSDFHCLVIDLPGMGRSPIANGPYDLEQLAESCRKVFRGYKAYDIHCIGWSLGAIVAQALAVSMDFQSITSVCMGPWFLQSSRKQIAYDLPAIGMADEDFAYFKALFRDDVEGTVYRFLSLNTKGSRSQRQELRVLQQLVNSYGLPAPKALAGGLNILEDAVILSAIQKATCSQLMIFGKHDALVPIDFAPWVEENLSSVAIQVFQDAGHIPFLTDPSFFVECVHRFIKS